MGRDAALTARAYSGEALTDSRMALMGSDENGNHPS